MVRYVVFAKTLSRIFEDLDAFCLLLPVFTMSFGMSEPIKYGMSDLMNVRDSQEKGEEREREWIGWMGRWDGTCGGRVLRSGCFIRELDWNRLDACEHWEKDSRSIKLFIA